jgi:hypothetical protein
MLCCFIKKLFGEENRNTVRLGDSIWEDDEKLLMRRMQL